MIYLLAVIAGLIAAVIGWFISGVIAVWIAGLYGMSDFEGGRGMFAFLFVGPLGGLVSMVVAAWLVVRLGKGPAPLLAHVGRTGVVLGAIVAVVAAGIALRLYSIDTYSSEAPPMLEFEVRVPATLAVPPRAEVSVELHTDKNVGTGQLYDDWSQRDGHHVINGGVQLAFKTRSRILVVAFPSQPTRLFRLPLARDPSSTGALSDWHHADHLDAPGEGQPRRAPPDDPVEVRYRVRRAGEE